MAKYGQVSYGSKGSDVTELQKLLNNNGYNLSVDGDFGSKTQAAVKDYQQKNGLAVDGIVGTNTWGALTNAQTPSAQTPAQTTPAVPQQEAPKFEYTPYQPSETVAQADALLQQMMATKPGEYRSTWEGQLKDTIAQILNREKFSYDLNGDALYQQMKDQYINQGQMAMMDAMGKAATMTGGYGNSYAQTVGQQAYQEYLKGLNDKVPELYGMARDQYNREGQALYDQASLLAGMEDQEYGRYMDQLTNYYTELGLARDEARYQAEQEYARYMDKLGLDYQMERDKVADEQWQAQFDEEKRQYDEQMAQSKSKSSGSGGSGGGADNGSRSKAQIIAMQRELGVEPDGKWGANSQAAAQKKWGTTDADAAWAANEKMLKEQYEGINNPTDTDNTKLFRSSIMTSQEFARHGNKATVKGKTYTNYKSYIEAALADWTDNDVPYIGKNLTDDEVEFLMDYYGL